MERSIAANISQPLKELPYQGQNAKFVKGGASSNEAQMLTEWNLSANEAMEIMGTRIRLLLRPPVLL